jgi:hypothetical protein
MSKYNFHKWKSKYNHDPLPEDINSQIESLAVKINDNEGKASLESYRKNRWYGQVLLWDMKKRHVVTAYFDHGICFRFEKTAYRKENVLQPVAIQSVKNENLDEKGAFQCLAGQRKRARRKVNNEISGK